MQRVFHLRPKIGEAARMATFGNYAILFRVIGEVVRIERVVYGGRDLPDVFEL
jgi:plasmid stabilization system protein ParE